MLRQRILTALVLAPLAIALILFAPTPLFALAAAAAFLGALWEWTQLGGLRAAGARAALLVIAAIIFEGLWYVRLTAWMPALLAIGVAWWLLVCGWLRRFAFGAAPTRENTALKMLAGGLVIFPAWMALISIHARTLNGHGWTLLALMLVWAADIGAYFSGRLFGRRKLAPQISPGKTWAGAWGALIAGMLVATAGAWLLQVRGVMLVALGVLGGITVAISIVGDLFESLMKRHAQVKDSGTLFPGHGGLLDRLDSVFAALPLFAAGLWLLLGPG